MKHVLVDLSEDTDEDDSNFNLVVSGCVENVGPIYC